MTYLNVLNFNGKTSQFTLKCFWGKIISKKQNT